jgi:hypothetical protein
MQEKSDIERKRQNIESELVNLRGLLSEIISRYQANLEADIVTCIDMIATQNEEDRLSILSNPKALNKILKSLQKTKLKPAKGRLKDINRIDRTIEKIYDILVEK